MDTTICAACKRAIHIREIRAVCTVNEHSICRTCYYSYSGCNATVNCRECGYCATSIYIKTDIDKTEQRKDKITTLRSFEEYLHAKLQHMGYALAYLQAAEEISHEEFLHVIEDIRRANNLDQT